MKKMFCLLTTIMFLGCHFSVVKGALDGKNSADESTLNVYSTPGLYDMVMKWGDEYTAKYPEIKIVVTQQVNYEVAQTGQKRIIITDDESVMIRNKDGFSAIVGRDIIVPIMNKKNPDRKSILMEGITPQSLQRMLKSPQDVSLKCCLSNNSNVIKGVQKFMNTSDLKSIGFEIFDEKDVIESVDKEPNAIGFVNLDRVTIQDKQTLMENMELVPIDKNGNGKIDYMEGIYDNLQAFERGVWIGKYPYSLSKRIYAVSADKPTGRMELSFIAWILTDGQKTMSNFGYNNLILNERQAQLSKIEPILISPAFERKPLSPIIWIMTFLLVSGIIIMFWRVMTKLNRRGKNAALNTHISHIRVFDEKATQIPGGLFFDWTHTWTFMKKDGTLRVGVDDFLQHVTGKITRAELRKTGDKIKKGEHLLTLVQKGKQLDLYSPVSGTIREKNKALIENPSLINSSPYDDGWIYTIEPKNWQVEMPLLQIAEIFQSELKKEFLRLKDFLVSVLRSNEHEYALVLQDGGVLKDNILEELGPEVWDDFQTRFIDAAAHQNHQDRF